MCRMMALTCDQYISPMEAVNGLSAMQEGYDGSGMGILLRDLGGPFETLKSEPILSGIFSREGLKRLDRFMLRTGFTTKYKITFKLANEPPCGTPRRDVYLVRAYESPPEYESLTTAELHQRYTQLRLELKQMGDAENDMMVFSFWPDTIVMKEIGEPTELARYFDLGRQELQAKVIMAQGRQNTNYAIDLYACHPFFLQGFATMTNGENTAFISNREFLSSRGFCGYTGYHSDSEVFTHSLHYTMTCLGLGIEAYKHVVTPLDSDLLRQHPDADFLTYLKYACRHLIIDGPNCVVGCLPDNTVFMVQDRKKLRPGVVGGMPGKYGFASEVCGLDAALADRNPDHDYQPMHLETVAVAPNGSRMDIYRQNEALLSN